MIYLLAKYALLFLLVAMSSYLFGSWMTRRKFIDVSDSYEDLRSAGNADAESWERLWSRLDSLPQPEVVDLSIVSKRLEYLEKAVKNIPPPERVNLESIEVGLEDVKKTVGSIPIPLSQKPLSLDPVSNKLVDLDANVEALQSQVERIPADIAPVSARLEKVEQAILAFAALEPNKTPDLSPIQANLAEISEEIRRVPLVEKQQPVNLEPIERRLVAIESDMRSVKNSLTASFERREMHTAPKRNEPTILSAALYGKKDDLRLISGVGPKLERLLNKNGVYYFWQVAEWTRQDIDVMDQRLETFKGRIERDNWVSQSQKLRRQDGAAQQPDTLW
ncbi:MAG: hypothetical protein ACR2Q3_18255 [Woeseiaceae bacterium]